MNTVYKITCKQNSKIYIGQTRKSIEERWKAHCHSCNNPARNHYKFIKAIKKYGADSFTKEIIKTGLTQSEADQLEVECILKFNSVSEGYNTSHGGQTPRGIISKRGNKNKCSNTSTYMFTNNTETFEGTLHDFKNHTGFKHGSVLSLVSGRNSSLFGWTVDLPKVVPVSQYITVFNSETEREYTGTYTDLSLLEGSPPHSAKASLKRGKRFKQWCTYCPIEKPLFRDWIHPKYGIVLDKRPKDLKEELDSTISTNVLNQVARYNPKYKSHKQWRIYEKNNN